MVSYMSKTVVEQKAQIQTSGSPVVGVPPANWVEDNIVHALKLDFEERKSILVKLKEDFMSNLHDELADEDLKALNFRLHTLPQVWGSFTFLGEEYSLEWADYGEQWDFRHNLMGRWRAQSGSLHKELFAWCSRCSESLNDMRRAAAK